MFGRRPDATRVRELSTVRRFMPFVSPHRNASVVYFDQEVDVEAALQQLEAHNQTTGAERHVTLFHLVLVALTRVLDERPRLNRFVAGDRLWQRDGIWISFSAKQRFEDDASILTVKLRIDPSESADTLAARIHEVLGARRAGAADTSEREMRWALRMPSVGVRLALRALRTLDGLGLLPAAMIREDPLFASAFVANLGSVGLDAGYHHLWEYGNIPIFCVVGRIRSGHDQRRRVHLKFTYDERVEDGFYCARSLDRLRAMLEDPAGLLAAASVSTTSPAASMGTKAR